MSNQFPEWFVRQFSSNVYVLSQQQGSRLQPNVRVEEQSAEKKSWDRIGPTTAVKRTSRHADTPLVNSAHSRRTNFMDDYEWADLVDDQDKIRALNDPTSQYAQAASWALGRTKDDIIIAAALGSAYSGVDGLTAVTFPASQQVVATDGVTAAGVNLNVLTLRLVKKKFWSNEAVMPGQEIHFAVTGSQLYSLLGQTQVTSSDYNSIKALVQGEVDTFMGFKFHRLERLLATTATTAFNVTDGSTVGGALASTLPIGGRRCFAWVKEGLLLGMGKDIEGKIDPRVDKSYSVQVYAKMSCGATRMEEEKVVEVLCNEA